MNSLDNLYDISLSDSKLRKKNSIVSVKQIQTGLTNQNKQLKSKLVKRPSEIYLNSKKNRSSIAVQERPKSGDSILSIQSNSTDTDSSFFSKNLNNESNSRLSSLTSYSNLNSPVINSTRKFETLDYNNLKKGKTTNEKLNRSSSISNISNNSYQKHSPQLRKIKSKSSLYSTKDEIKARQIDFDNDDDFIIEDNYLLTFNIPLAQPLSVNVMNHSKNILNEKLIRKKLNDYSINPLPLPGKLMSSSSSEDISPVEKTNKSSEKDLENLSPIAQNLTNFYSNQTKHATMKKIEQRNSLKIPNFVKNQKDVQDLKLISNEKLNLLNQSRPIHLPPKSATDIAKHDKEINTIISSISHKILSNNMKNDMNSKKMSSLNKIWMNLNEHDVLSSKILSSEKYGSDLIWKCFIPEEIKFELLTKFLHFMSQEDTEDTGYDLLIQKFDSLSSSFRSNQDSKFDKLINFVLHQPLYYSIFRDFNDFEKDTFKEKFKLMLYLKLLSNEGLHKHDELMLIPMILFNFPCIEISKLLQFLNLINLNVLNKKSLNSLNSNLSKWDKNTKVVAALKNFKNDEIVDNNFLKFLHVINKIGFKTTYNSSIKSNDENENLSFINFFIQSLIVLGNKNLKIVECFILIILKNYHFGFLDFNQLIKSNESFVNLISLNNFIDKFFMFYKKY